jgi:hypothetical protein
MARPAVLTGFIPALFEGWISGQARDFVPPES